MTTVRDFLGRLLKRAAQFNSRLYGAFITFTIVVVAASLIAYVGARHMGYHLERTDLAHQVHARYLNVSANTYHLFSGYSDDPASYANQDGDSLLLQEIRADLSAIRLLTAEEVKHVGENEEDEVEELASLALLERQIDDILREYTDIWQLRQEGETALAEARLATLYREEITGAFGDMIDDLIAEEAREVAESQEGFAQFSDLLRVSTRFLVFAAVPIAMIMIILLMGSFHRALQVLIKASEAYSIGRLDYRIPKLGIADFDKVGGRINKMVSELAANRADLSRANEALEETVKERTAELEAANERLTETDGARRRLFADISHELRTPLTVIRGEAEITLRGEDKEADEYRTTLTRIVEQAAHTTRLVDDLLFIARSDSGQPRLEMRSVALMPLLASTVEAFRAVADKKRIKIKEDVDVSDIVVLGDQGRLRQVFSIIIDNAIRYSNPDDEVRIRVYHGVSGIVVMVEDDGIGIEEEDLSRVFQRFYRGGNAVEHSKGSGLGLPVAKAIVDAHKGRIELVSREGNGATVKVTLPVENKLRAVS